MDDIEIVKYYLVCTCNATEKFLIFSSQAILGDIKLLD